MTTLTKKMAEDLTDYLVELGVRVRYLHSDIDTIDPPSSSCRDLRLGEYDVLVGINLLREGLDLPEVPLVAILDADKTGFLRSASSLIQTMGRAARNVDGLVVLYADTITDAMRRHLRDPAPPLDAAGLQRRARHRPGDHPQGRYRHPRRIRPAGSEVRRAARPQKAAAGGSAGPGARRPTPLRAHRRSGICAECTRACPRQPVAVDPPLAQRRRMDDGGGDLTGMETPVTSGSSSNAWRRR